MNHPISQHCIALIVRALLILLCVLAVPKLASSEADLTDQDIAWSQRPKVTHEGIGHPTSTSLRLFAENKDCAVVKLDIWLRHGTVTHSASLSDGGVNFRTWGARREGP